MPPALSRTEKEYIFHWMDRTKTVAVVHQSWMVRCFPYVPEFSEAIKHDNSSSNTFSFYFAMLNNYGKFDRKSVYIVPDNV